MSVAKHTPGPWKLINNRPGEILIASFDNTRGIAEVTASPAFGWRDSAEPSANARLIAAAPELLEAHHATVESLNMLLGSRAFVEKVPRKVYEGLAAIRGVARAAIAKAERGES